MLGLSGKGLKDILITNISTGNITLCGVQHVATKLQVEWALV